MGRGPHPRRGPRAEELSRTVGRGPLAEQGQAHRPLLRRRRAFRDGRRHACQARLHERPLHGRRVQPLEGLRVPLGEAREPHGRSGAAVLTAPPYPGGGRGGAAQAAEVESAPHRRGRARLAGGLLPRSGRRGDARHRRLGRRRRDEPAAPDPPFDRADRRAEGGFGEGHARGDQSGRDRHPVQGAPHLREHRPDHRGLRRRHRRRRQLPHALPVERRVDQVAQAGGPRLHLPVRGAGHRVQALRRPVLPLPVPPAAAAGARALVRGGGCPRRASRSHRDDPGERGPQAPSRDRRAPRRPLSPL